LIQNLLTQDPKIRMHIEDVLNHKFLYIVDINLKEDSLMVLDDLKL
jgi:hypothetical protein